MQSKLANSSLLRPEAKNTLFTCCKVCMKVGTFSLHTLFHKYQFLCRKRRTHVFVCTQHLCIWLQMFNQSEAPVAFLLSCRSDNHQQLSVSVCPYSPIIQPLIAHAIVDLEKLNGIFIIEAPKLQNIMYCPSNNIVFTSHIIYFFFLLYFVLILCFSTTKCKVLWVAFHK